MTKPVLHVAIVIDSWFPGKKRIGVVGGGQIHVHEIMHRLNSKHRVKFTLFFPAYDNIFYRLFWPFICYIRLIQSHRQHAFNLIHSHGLISAFITSNIYSIIKIPVIQTVHGTHLMDLKSKSIKAWFQRQAFTQKKFAAEIGVSSTFLKYPNINTNIHIIPNGVNIADFNAVTVAKNPHPTIIWVGRDDPSKGVEILRQAVARLRKKIPNLQAKLITGGALRGKALIRAYKRSHLFVLPSLAESQPITLLEAWAAKLPVVATSVGDNPNMVKNGVNGYLVEPGNVNQLTQAIQKTLRARNKDIKMGQAGFDMVKKHYSWDKTATKTWQVYQQVITA